MSYPAPYILSFPRHGEGSIGYISVTSNDKLPFKAERVFWTYYTPESIVRGRHAHHRTEQILIAVTGRIIVTTDDGKGNLSNFVLDTPDKGLYIPPNVWHTMQYSHTSVQLVLASTLFDEKDYIRDYNEFCKIWGQ